MTQGSYRQFCPVAMASEILCTRWTMIILRELVCGSTRFNDLRRGIPRISPALLSLRLKELEAADIVYRETSASDPSVFEYHLTASGRALEPVIMAIALWGQHWIEAEPSLKNLDVSLLMWDMRRNIDPRPLPRRRIVIQFQYPERPASQRTWWLLVTPNGEVDLCSLDPGFDVDLYVVTDLRTMTAIWLGLESVRAAVGADRMMLTGDRKLAADMQTWLGLSRFAKERKLASFLATTFLSAVLLADGFSQGEFHQIADGHTDQFLPVAAAPKAVGVLAKGALGICFVRAQVLLEYRAAEK